MQGPGAFGKICGPPADGGRRGDVSDEGLVLWDVLREEGGWGIITRDAARDDLLRFLGGKLRDERWLGMMLRAHGRALPAAPAFMITEATTPDLLLESIVAEARAAHPNAIVFVETLDPSGVFLDIHLGV